MIFNCNKNIRTFAVLRMALENREFTILASRKLLIASMRNYKHHEYSEFEFPNERIIMLYFNNAFTKVLVTFMKLVSSNDGQPRFNVSP